MSIDVSLKKHVTRMVVYIVCLLKLNFGMEIKLQMDFVL